MSAHIKLPVVTRTPTRGSTATRFHSSLLWGSVSVLMWSLACHLPVKISGYRGDGTISRTKFFLNPGARVDLEKFSLASPYKAEYRLDGLPKHRSGYFVGLGVDVVQADYSQWPKQIMTGPNGVITLRLRDAGAQVLFDCTGPVDKLEWTWVVGERLGWFGNLFGPKTKTSFIFPEYFDSPSASYVLEVSYEPAVGAPDVKAWVRLSAGGQK